MKNILLKPIYSIVILFSIISFGTISYLSWSMITSDKKQSRFDEIKQIKVALNKSITPSEKSYFDRLILNGDNSTLLQRFVEIKNEVKKIPASSFNQKKEILNKVNTLEGKFNSNTKFKLEIGVLEKNLLSFYKLVRSNSWTNLLKITNGSLDRVKKIKKSTKLINVKKNIETLDKDFNLIYRVAEVSTLSQSKKEIIKKRVEKLRENQKSVMSLVDRKINLLKDTESVLQGIASLIKEIGVIKNENVLAMHERSFVIKNVVSFYSVILCLFLISIIFLGQRDAKKTEVDFQHRFWKIVKNLILSSGKATEEYDLEGKFFSEVVDCRNFIKKNELYGNLLKDTLPEGALIFEASGDLVWSNHITKEIFKGYEIINFNQLVDYFSISDIISGSEGFNLSIEKDAQWFSLNVVKVLSESESYSIVYISRVEEKKISDSPESEGNLVDIEQCLDDVLNKNDSIAFDSFVKQSEDPLTRIREKTSRIAKIFNSIEESFLGQIKELDDISLDNTKLINDVKTILFSKNDKKIISSEEVKKSFVGLSSSVENLVNDYVTLSNEYLKISSVNNKNLKIVENTIGRILKAGKGTSVDQIALQELMVELGSVEIIEPLELSNFDSADLERHEENLATLIGSYMTEMDDLRSALIEVKSIISIDSNATFEISNHKDCIGDQIVEDKIS